MKWKIATKIILKPIKFLIFILGISFAGMILLSFTSVPFKIYHFLGTSQGKISFKPDYIILMGAGAMPGPGNLMRSYFTLEASRAFPEAKVIIALPADTSSLADSHAGRLSSFLVSRGLDTARIFHETRGTNTRTQACEIYHLLKKNNSLKLLIVSSPEHIYRSVLTFRKCGFQYVSGLPCFEGSFSADLLLTEKEKRDPLKSLERSVKLRYNVWNYLILQIVLLREFTAIGYYKLKGYI